MSTNTCCQSAETKQPAKKKTPFIIGVAILIVIGALVAGPALESYFSDEEKPSTMEMD